MSLLLHSAGCAENHLLTFSFFCFLSSAAVPRDFDGTAAEDKVLIFTSFFPKGGPMPRLISAPTRFPDETMTISEFFGRISTGSTQISIARLTSAAGWSEPAQCPEFDEFTLVLKGALYLTSEDGNVTIVRENQAVLVPAGERVQYSSPETGEADYVAVCLPAFAPELSHREPA